MPGGKKSRKTESKGITAEAKNVNTDENLTMSDSDSVWKSPSKLKEEVQTIIDIMGPPLSPKFSYNTSSEADNEESIFTNSKFSSIKFKPRCDCNDDSEKTDFPDLPSKDESNISAAADMNTSTLTATMDDLTDTKGNFPYDENYCPAIQYICPPPIIPTNVCVNSECLCPQVASILHGRSMPPSYPPKSYGYGPGASVSNNKHNDPLETRQSNNNNKDLKNGVMHWLRAIVSSSHRPMGKDCNCEYYRMNMKKNRGNDNSPPRRVVFDLVQDVPRSNQNYNVTDNTEQKIQCCSKDKKNMDNVKMADLQTQTQKTPCKDISKNCEHDCPTVYKKPMEKTTYCDTRGKTRVDVYYFDHGSFNHYSTTDAPPLVTTEGVADKTEKTTTRFWAEIFGTIHIGISFITSFILQLFRFVLYSICRPLTIGLIQLASDYFFKPLLATMFNGVVQPILIFCYNIAASMRDLCDPISEGIGYFLREIAVILRAFRLIEVNSDNCKCQMDCKCEKKSKKNKISC